MSGGILNVFAFSEVAIASGRLFKYGFAQEGTIIHKARVDGQGLRFSG